MSDLTSGVQLWDYFWDIPFGGGNIHSPGITETDTEVLASHMYELSVSAWFSVSDGEGGSASVQLIPEPSTTVLAGMFAMLFWIFRRRT